MAKKYAVNGMVVGNVVFAGVQNKAYDSGSACDIYTLMFVSPEGVTFTSEKKVWTKGKDGSIKTPVKFVSDWVNNFHKIKDTVDSNKAIADKSLRDLVFVKANMYPAKDGRMFGSINATVNDKGRRNIRLNDVMPSLVAHTKDAEGNVIINFDRDEYIYKITTAANGRQGFTSEKKKNIKFDDILTRFKVAMIAREVNGDEVVFVEDDGEYAATIETISHFDNSRIEIGQGYEFEIVFKKGEKVEKASTTDEDEDDFGWDTEVSSKEFVELPATVEVFMVRGKVAGYDMNVEDDYTSGDYDGGF